MSYEKIIGSRQLGTLSTEDWIEYNPFVNKGTFFPRTINFEDIDQAVYNWFKSRDIVLNDNVVPAFFLSHEKWAEFKRQWKYVDGDRNVDYPYITIRRSDFKQAQEPVKSRIPGKKYTIYRIPHYTPGGATYKHYRVPQPIQVDFEYEVRILTHYMADINSINETIIKHFASLQAYLDLDGHYMPMKIEDIGDESNFDNIEDERVLQTRYVIKTNGYIIDEEEFEEKIGISSIQVIISEDLS